MTSTLYRTNKSLNRSGNFTATKTLNNPSLRSSQNHLKNDAKNLLASSSFENIEMEYIRNLKEQIKYLELECTFLRQQLNLNGLQTSYKYDQQTQELKNEMMNIHMEKTNLEKSLIEENYEKQTVLQMLQQAEKNHQRERDLLLKEITLLKRQKNETEENLISKTVELSRAQDNLEKHHLSSSQSSSALSKFESQMDLMRRDSVAIRAELNESRALLIKRDNLIKELQEQLNDQNKKYALNDLKSSLNNVSAKLTLTNEVLSKETATTKHLQEENNRLARELESYKIQLNESKRENARITSSLEASLKQNESDLLLAKKNADLSKAGLDKLQADLQNEKSVHANLLSQIEQFKLQERLEIKNQGSLKSRIKELEDSLSKTANVYELELRTLKEEIRAKQHQLDVEQSKWSHDHNSLLSAKTNLELRINELNDQIDKQSLNHKLQNETNKAKLSQLQSQLDAQLENYKLEKNNNSSLLTKIESFQRQETIQTNMIGSLKTRINELEDELSQHKLKDNNLLNQLREANQKLSLLEIENRQLQVTIDDLSLKLREIDRLKQLEDLVQSQRWTELGQLAESMKTLSRTMASNTSIESTTNLINNFQ